MEESTLEWVCYEYRETVRLMTEPFMRAWLLWSRFGRTTL